MQDGAKWFRCSAFGDEKDRVVQRENGQYTYFASDIAYHLNKFERGFDLVIDVWGADHHGYIPRVKGALQALGLDPDRLTVALVQFAVLYRDGKKVRCPRAQANSSPCASCAAKSATMPRGFSMCCARATSTWTSISIWPSRRATTTRCTTSSTRTRASAACWNSGARTSPALLRAPISSRLTSEQELQLLRLLMDYPAVIEDAARDLAPHLVAFYLKDLAAAFHSYYNSTRFLVDDERVSLARLALVVALRQVLRNGLRLLGVSAPTKM